MPPDASTPSTSSAEDVNGPPPRRAAVVFIFITVMLDMLAMGMIVPVLPTLVRSFVEGDTARAAMYLGLFGTSWAVMQSLFMPVLGTLADAHGRRPIVLLSNFGLGFDYLMMALAPSLWFLFAGRLVSGITAASITTANAYIADVTPRERRAAAFGYLGAAFGIGFIIGPAFGGLLGHIGPRVPFWVAAGLSIANGTYGIFVLPESLPVERRTPFAWSKASPRGSLAILSSNPRLLRLAMVQFLSFLSFGVLPAVSALYAIHRYGWKEGDIGLMLASVGACSLIVQIGLVRRIVARIGERNAVIVGLLFGAVSFIVYAAAPTGTIFLLGVPLMAMRGLAAASVQSMTSQQVDPSQQGRLQGAISSLQGVAGIFAPSLFSGTFSLFVGRWSGLNLPGAPFLIATVLTLTALGLAIRSTRPAPPAPSVAPNP